MLASLVKLLTKKTKQRRLNAQLIQWFDICCADVRVLGRRGSFTGDAADDFFSQQISHARIKKVTTRAEHCLHGLQSIEYFEGKVISGDRRDLSAALKQLRKMLLTQ